MKKIFLLAFCLSFINVAISGACIGTVKISATPASVNFGSVALGATSAPKVVTLKNTGICDLSITTISITGTDISEFGQTNSCVTIAPGGSCLVSVTFTPALPYAKKTALLTIASDDPKKPLLNIKLSGQVPPPKISATPGSLNFGKLPPGKAISKKSVTVKNSGLSDLMISLIDIVGTDPGDFTATNHCGTVPKGGFCTIDVVFEPLVVKVTRSASLYISSNDPKKPVLKVKLSGATGWGKSTISLPKTGQTKCYDASGTEIPCAGTGQDGDWQEGVAWPNPRFTDNDNSDGTITDKLTGLMWTQDGAVPGPAGCTPGLSKSWQGALNYVACLNTNNYLGYNDWRLPNVNELRSLANYSQSNPATWLNTQGFSNAQAGSYWSSTTSGAEANNAWIVSMYNGGMSYGVKTVNAYYVWPVRAGQAGTVDLPQTGQTTSYATGDDGDLQEGAAWPVPRFTNHHNGTITDKLTGLMWTQDGSNESGPAACTTGGLYRLYTWPNALIYVACLNTNKYLGHNDWRLPNVNELASLIHSGQADIAAWLNTQGFSNVQAEWYLSSTTYAPNTSYAWSVTMGEGNLSLSGKTNNAYVWPVRAGQ